MAQLESLMRRHFVDYASYFILDRAIPDLRDGLKPVQRRILHTLYQIDDGRYHKVASVIGDTMKLHPHGDAAIGDALVVLANKDYFIDRQGNYGNVITGHPAAAARYIECRLTELARETLFNEDLTEFAPSYDGRSREPLYLPVKLPVVLMLGTEGIAVGMATRILPHNLPELWEAQIELLNGRTVELVPDFPQGGSVDVDAYDDGRGKVEVRAKLEGRGEHTIVVTEIPFGTTTESLIASIEAGVQRGRVKVASINDYTTDRVEIELKLVRGARPDEVIPQLYAYTDCAVSVSSNIVVIRDRRPVELTVSEILRELTDKLREQIGQELDIELGKLVDRQHWLTLEQLFVEKRVYKRIEEAETQEAVRSEVVTGMNEYAELFVRPLTDDDVKRLLEVRIRRISLYDIEKNRQEIEEVLARIEETREKREHLTRTTIEYVEDLMSRYADRYPRRTSIATHRAIDKKAVAQASIKLSYDADTGFFGQAVKGERFKLTVSEFDLVLGISDDGSYRVMPPVDKVLFSGKLVYCAPFDPETGCEFVIAYRDASRTAFAKRVKIHKFVRNREYHLIKDKAGKIDLLLRPDEAGVVMLRFAKAPRQRVTGARFDLRELERTAATSRGTRMAPKPVVRIQMAARAKSTRKQS